MKVEPKPQKRLVPQTNALKHGHDTCRRAKVSSTAKLNFSMQSQKTIRKDTIRSLCYMEGVREGDETNAP